MVDYDKIRVSITRGDFVKAIDEIQDISQEVVSSRMLQMLTFRINMQDDLTLSGVASLEESTRGRQVLAHDLLKIVEKIERELGKKKEVESSDSQNNEPVGERKVNLLNDLQKKKARKGSFYALNDNPKGGKSADNSVKQISYDIVLCVDCTGSMGHVLDLLKDKSAVLAADIVSKGARKGIDVAEIRLRVIAFRDYRYDGSKAMLTTGFLTLPAQNTEFSSFISKLHSSGGGDEPESGLEALNIAMSSDWKTDGGKRRHVIVVLTDASAHRLEDRVGERISTFYPRSLAKNFDELTDLWEGNGKLFPVSSWRRLLLFCPDVYPWIDVSNNWELAISHGMSAGHGLSDLSYEVLINSIVNT